MRIIGLRLLKPVIKKTNSDGIKKKEYDRKRWKVKIIHSEN